MKLRPFGEDDIYSPSLSALIGHLETLITAEEERGDIAAHHSTPRGKRLNKVYDALSLLEDADQS